MKDPKGRDPSVVISSVDGDLFDAVLGEPRLVCVHMHVDVHVP